MNSLLIEAEELKNYKDIGNKIDINKINPIIAQAQDIDLRDFLGMKFYFEILSKKDNEVYQDLLNGSNFIVDGITYFHEGLKSMLSDLFMARFILQINTNITPFGATVKQSQDSEPADRSSLKDISTINKQSAGSKWEIIKLFLNVNRAKFPAYNSFTDTISTGEKRLKFTRI